MMILIKKVKASYFKIHNDFLTVLENDNSPLFIYDLKLFEQIKKIGENYGGGLYIVKNYIFDESFKGIDINTLSEKIFFEKENIFYYIVNNKYGIVRKFIEEFEVEFYLLDIKNFQILQKVDFQGEIVLFSEIGDIISNIDNTLFKYSNFSLLWQKDLSEITSYTDWDGKHQGNVKNVYLYENKLIVVSGNSVLAMNIETADILWQIKYNDFQPFTLHINNHFAYLSKGVFYSVIDLEKGEKVLETMLIRPFDHDPEYEKANLAMVGSDMTFYDNYLYFTDKHKGEYYLAKLNPHTAKIEEYQFLEEVKSNLAPPKFYDNKMFLLDSNNNLFIYQRE